MDRHVQPTVEELYRGMGRMIVRFYGRTPGSECIVASHAILGCSGLGSIFLNCGVVFGDGTGGEDPAEGRFREFVALIRERGVGGYVCLSDGVQRRLEPLARELGLDPLPAIPLLTRAGQGGGAVRGDGVSGCEEAGPGAVERVATDGGLTEFLTVSEAAFDLPADLYGRVITPASLHDPGFTIYLVRLEGRAVACACVGEEEGLAGITGMATVPELQRHGIGARLLRFVLREHGPRARAFYLTATDAGQRLYRGCGFETVDAATAWVVPPPQG